MNMSLVLHLPREIYLCRSSSNVSRLPSFLEMLQNPHFFFRLENPLRLPIKTTLQRPKAAWTCGALCILTSTCASCHNGVRFFNISTSKSVPRLTCFVHFDFQMCFAPQRRALLRHQLLKVLRCWGALCILTWKCASRYNRVQFFISHLASWLRTRRFSEPTFRPAGATNHWKYTVFRAFSTFSRTCIFFLLTLSLLWSSLFFSDSSHLCFSSCPYCRKFDF